MAAPLLRAPSRVMTVVRLRPAVAALAALSGLAAAPAPAPAQALDAATLRERLTREIGRAGAFSGAYARDLGTGTDIVAVREDLPRIPASVEKLFVTATALLRYGPTEELQTRVFAGAPVDAAGTLSGDLWLVGGGDPALEEADLARLASAVRAAGVSRVAGAVAGDESRFDPLRGGPRTAFRPDRDLGGRIGALVLRRGFQPNPALFAAQRFVARLRAAGVQVAGRTRTGVVPPEASEIAVDGSLPIADLIRRTNVPSDNFFAEMLLKSLGAAYAGTGTTAAGGAVVRDTLDDFGVRPRIVDGSGLSRANRTTPRQVVRLIERMNGQEAGATWTASLAVAGRSGTVRRRMRGTAAQGRCRLKTGTIFRVSNLAGVCTTTGGRTVAFAWLMNGVNPSGARRIQDRMTAALARYSG
jgi:D-alanyl-D-alanine carboxypeptidase/D-alanyl-D-alanine-endopeptidase (penicillin-binding protein 4)